MLDESLFGPASCGINVWCSASKFVDKLVSAWNTSYYYKAGNKLITDYIEAKYGKIDWMLMDKHVPLVLEVGKKNQFEIMLTSKDWIKYRFTPSGYQPLLL